MAQTQLMQQTLYFRVYGELFVVDLRQTMYFKADDHYTHVYYASGMHFMIPFGLSKVEAQLSECAADVSRFSRLGRTYIVDTSRIFHINAVKQVAVVCDNHGTSYSIHLPKAILHTLMNSVGGNNTTIPNDGEQAE